MCAITSTTRQAVRSSTGYNGGTNEIFAGGDQRQIYPLESGCLQSARLCWDEDPGADIEIGEYTINHQMDLILQDIYRRKPDFIGFSCYIWNISYIMEIVRDVKKVLPEVEIWLGGPEVSYDAKKVLTREPDVCGVMRGKAS